MIDLIAAACPTVTLALSNALQWREEQMRANSRAAVVAVGRIALSDAPIAEKLTRTAEACTGIHRVDVVKVIEANFRTDEITVLAAAAREPIADTIATGLLAGASACQLLNPDQPLLDAFQFAATDPTIAPELREVLRRCGESIAFFSLGSETDKARLLDVEVDRSSGLRDSG